ncbi:MAG: serine hydrolase domain-containing protein [Burkholderiales bacterium]
MSPFPRRRFLASALCAPALVAGCVDDVTPTSTRYATAMKRVIDRFGIPGALANVRVPGDAEWRQASGFADVASGASSDFAGHYPIRSVTKSFTVTLILQLVRDGAITLDDKLARFVPGIPNADAITIADLAGNQSGLYDYSQTQAFLAAFVANLERTFTEQELVSYAIPQSPKFAPGAAYDYSNTNTVLLGVVAQQLTGLTLAQALALRVFGPLGLAQTSYPYVVPLPAPHPTPYDVDFASHALDVTPLISPTSLAGSGAMVSTLDDLARWARELGEGTLIGPQLQQERTRRSRTATNGPHYDRYGLGLGILHGWQGHTGSGLGFQAATFYDPRTAATITVLVNATPSGAAPADLNYAEEIFLELSEVVATR